MDELLLIAIEKFAEFEDSPPGLLEWRDYAYRIESGGDQTRREARREVEDLLVNTVFGSRYDDVRTHPLWKITLQIAQHPSFEDSLRTDFLWYCSDENIHLKNFLFRCFLWEDTDGGKEVEVEISVPESREQRAIKRARGWMEYSSERLVKQFYFQHPTGFSVTLLRHEDTEPRKEATVRHLSSSRVN